MFVINYNICPYFSANSSRWRLITDFCVRRSIDTRTVQSRLIDRNILATRTFDAGSSFNYRTIADS